MEGISTVFLSSEGGSIYRVFWSKEGKETDYICKRTMGFGRNAYFNVLRHLNRKHPCSAEGLYLIHSQKEAVQEFLTSCVVFSSDILIQEIKSEKEELEKLEAVRLSIEKKLERQKFNLLANSRSCAEGRSSLSFPLIEEREKWRAAIGRTEKRLERAKLSEEKCKGRVLSLERELEKSGYRVESHCLVSETVIE